MDWPKIYYVSRTTGCSVDMIPKYNWARTSNISAVRAAFLRWSLKIMTSFCEQRSFVIILIFIHLYFVPKRSYASLSFFSDRHERHYWYRVNELELSCPFTATWYKAFSSYTTKYFLSSYFGIQKFDFIISELIMIIMQYCVIKQQLAFLNSYYNGTSRIFELTILCYNATRRIL